MGILVSMCPRAYFVNSENLNESCGEEYWLAIGEIAREFAEEETDLLGKEFSRKERDKERKKIESCSLVDGNKLKGDQTKLNKTDDGSGIFDKDILCGVKDQPSTLAVKVVDEKRKAEDSREKLAKLENPEELSGQNEKGNVKGKGRKAKKKRKKKESKKGDSSLAKEAKEFTCCQSDQPPAVKNMKGRPISKRVKEYVERQAQLLSLHGKGGGKTAPRILESDNQTTSSTPVMMNVKAVDSRVSGENARGAKTSKWAKLKFRKAGRKASVIEVNRAECKEKEAKKNEGSECQYSEKAKKKRKKRKKVGDSSLPNETNEFACKKSAEPRLVKNAKRRPVLKRVKDNFGRQVQLLSPHSKGGGKIAPRMIDSDNQTMSSTPAIVNELYAEHVFQMFEVKARKPPISVKVLSVDYEEESIKGRREFALNVKGVDSRVSGKSTSETKTNKWEKMKFWKAGRKRL